MAARKKTRGARRKAKTAAERPIEQYAHTDKQRANNPPVGLVTPESDRGAGRKAWAYDPHLDPQLQWTGKAEHTSFAGMRNHLVHVYDDNNLGVLWRTATRDVPRLLELLEPLAR